MTYRRDSDISTRRGGIRPRGSPFPLDPKCLREANEDNFDVEKGKEDFEFLKIEEGKEYKKILFYFHEIRLIRKVWICVPQNESPAYEFL
ncbi:hypothetical protein Avbf_01944 [Armadillidium vulgare]|nr:hypothetical protein Avbf_01944 [Armadillidium vulgare]